MQTKRVGSPTRRSIASETGSVWQQFGAWRGAWGAGGGAGSACLTICILRGESKREGRGPLRTKRINRQATAKQVGPSLGQLTASCQVC